MIAIIKRSVAFILAVFIVLSFTVRTGGTDTGGIDEENDVLDNRLVAVDRMIKGFENFEESIDLSDLNILPSELSELFAAATKNSPYLFYVENNLSYTYIKGGGVVSVIPKYIYAKSEAAQMVAYCKDEVKKLTSIATHGESELERALILHDLICDEFSYDLTLESNNMYTFLKNRRGTCQGYTWTYMAALREMEIECEYVASDTIVHIWLKLKIDGEWYHSDVTWDDPPRDEGAGKRNREHFLFSDDKADVDGYADRYSASESNCKSEKYDLFDFSSSIPPCSVAGDVDHNGAVGLADLLRLRIYLEQGKRDSYICLICADCDGDFDLDENDVDIIRKLLISMG